MLLCAGSFQNPQKFFTRQFRSITVVPVIRPLVFTGTRVDRFYSVFPEIGSRVRPTAGRFLFPPAQLKLISFKTAPGIQLEIFDPLEPGEETRDVRSNYTLRTSIKQSEYVEQLLSIFYFYTHTHTLIFIQL